MEAKFRVVSLESRLGQGNTKKHGSNLTFTKLISLSSFQDEREAKQQRDAESEILKSAIINARKRNW